MVYMPSNYVDDFVKQLRSSGEKLLDRAEAKVRKRGIEVDTVLVETVGRRVADLIVKQAKKWDADVIVLGTHGRRGLTRVLMGSDAETVLRETLLPVLLVRSPRASAGRRYTTCGAPPGWGAQVQTAVPFSIDRAIVRGPGETGAPLRADPCPVLRRLRGGCWRSGKTDTGAGGALRAKAGVGSRGDARRRAGGQTRLHPVTAHRSRHNPTRGANRKPQPAKLPCHLLAAARASDGPGADSTLA